MIIIDMLIKTGCWSVLLFFLSASGLQPPLLAQIPAVLSPVIKPVVNRDYLPTILGMINDAKKSIDFIQLEFHYDPTVKKIQDALKAAVKRGVVVRGILEDDIYFNPKSNEFLNRFGIKSVLDTPKKATHNKMFIVDGEKVLLGSTNLSGNSIDNNNETNIYAEDRRLGSFFESYFNKLLKNSYAEPEMEPLGLPGLWTVTNRQHFEALMSLLTGAKKRIRVMMYGMKYYTGKRYADSKTNRLINALIAARKRGVDVKVMLDRSDYNKILNKINTATRKHLEAGGVEVRYDPEKITTHAKLVIADGHAMVGSANWGYLAMDVRNECSLITSEPAAVSFFEDYFTKLWKEGAPLLEVRPDD
ncbi:MAG: phospholipase D-like domain-containing protein [Candidatus Euphemobacter frigidus]|nr:phospholipase D-like domain-containing protein [Candidatus Euphemobacter frigidus]MDP8275931.1 phospholipase D-like domain-containing protein [Candidatus Euphemobacter frigidus]